MRTALAASAVAVAAAQDPANGWIAYAVGEVPAGKGRITSLEMTWKVSENPSRGNAFFSPWFGMDPQDNLNLIQPVNPWGGSSWSMYTEYFQWSPEHNSNSPQEPVSAGQTLHGALTCVVPHGQRDCLCEVCSYSLTTPVRAPPLRFAPQLPPGARRVHAEPDSRRDGTLLAPVREVPEREELHSPLHCL